MRRLFLFAFATLVCLYTTHIPATMAHILITDGSMGAVLHVDPDDNPEANQQATLYFDFKDSQKSFESSLCNCAVVIKKGSEVVYSQTLALTDQGTSESSAVLAFTFPEAGVYKVIASGSPMSDSSFTPFSLSYDVRVSGASKGIKIDWLLWLHHGIFVVGILIFAGLWLYSSYRARHRKNVTS